MNSNGLTERLGRLWGGLPTLMTLALLVGLSGCATLEGLFDRDRPAQPTSIASPYATAPTANGVVEAWASPPQEVRTTEVMVMYRVFGGDAGQLGSWLSPDRPTSRAQVRASLALPPNNTAEFVSVVTVPAGTLIYTGVAGPAFGHPGGGRQVQLKELIPRESFGEPQPLGP